MNEVGPEKKKPFHSLAKYVLESHLPPGPRPRSPLHSRVMLGTSHEVAATIPVGARGCRHREQGDEVSEQIQHSRTLRLEFDNC